MQRDYQFQFEKQPPLLNGGEVYSAIDEAYLNGVYAGLSLHSLLTYGSSSHPVTYDYLEDETTQNLLNTPKTEPLFTTENASSDYAPPYNFHTDSLAASSSSQWQHMPNLLSLQPPALHQTIPKTETPSYAMKRRRQTLKLSDKIRILQKLLPEDQNRKTDMATVLEETCKYIKFLQAQISVLRSMPNSTTHGTSVNAYGTNDGDLGQLNRQELLQVVVNSPVAQTKLYSKESCVYSLEQLILLKTNAEKKALFHQMMLDSTF